MDTPIFKVILYKIIFYILIIPFTIKLLLLTLPLNQQILVIAGLFLIFFAIIDFIVMPIVFYFFIIPKIEKQIGQKLEFTLRIYDFSPLGFLVRYGEVASYIVKKQLGLKIKPNSQLALAKVHYDISLCSRADIIWSFIAQISIWIAIISGLIGFVATIAGPPLPVISY